MMRQIKQRKKTDRKGGRNARVLRKTGVRILLWMAVVCVLCCGCGKKGGAILIGDSGYQSEDDVYPGNQAGGDASSGTSDTGTAGSGGTAAGSASQGMAGAASTGADSAPGAAGAVNAGAGSASGGATAGSASAEASGTGLQGSSVETVSIRVYVCGAVVSPGVVEIPAGSRVEDALLAAGGFGDEAAREAVNLADWVNDGQKLYFPAEGEEYEADTGGAVSGGVVSAGEASAGLVNINTADAAALCTLSGVGESRAADIIAYREANGGFDCCEDIMKVPGIKNAMYEKIKDKITVK